jgi:hypothetical protein
MRRFVEGVDRGHTILFLESLDDWLDENNPVRVIDTFVDPLNLRALDWRWRRSRDTTRKSQDSTWWL